MSKGKDIKKRLSFSFTLTLLSFYSYLFIYFGIPVIPYFNLYGLKVTQGLPHRFMEIAIKPCRIFRNIAFISHVRRVLKTASLDFPSNFAGRFVEPHRGLQNAKKTSTEGACKQTR